MLQPTVLRFRCLFALAIIVVTAMALLPAPELPVTLWDKANHALAYFFLAWLGDRSFPSTTPGRPQSTLLLGLFFYGVLIEGLQSQIAYRQASLLDMVANGTGLVFYGVARALTVKHHA